MQSRLVLATAVVISGSVACSSDETSGSCLEELADEASAPVVNFSDFEVARDHDLVVDPRGVDDSLAWAVGQPSINGELIADGLEPIPPDHILCFVSGSRSHGDVIRLASQTRPDGLPDEAELDGSLLRWSGTRTESGGDAASPAVLEEMLDRSAFAALVTGGTESTWSSGIGVATVDDGFALVVAWLPPASTTDAVDRMEQALDNASSAHLHVDEADIDDTGDVIVATVPVEPGAVGLWRQLAATLDPLALPRA